MHWAVLGGHARVVEFLLSKGAWAEGYNNHDDTPLHIAARFLPRWELPAIRARLATAKAHARDAQDSNLHAAL